MCVFMCVYILCIEGRYEEGLEARDYSMKEQREEKKRGGERKRVNERWEETRGEGRD